MAKKYPHTLQEWQRYQEECWRLQRPDWIPKAPEIDYPEGYVWTDPDKGITIITLGPDDHPLKGSSLCWRCLAEAQGLAPNSVIPHAQGVGDICWEPPASVGVEPEQADPEPAEDGKPKQARIRVTIDGGQVIEASAAWLQRLDAEGQPVGPRIALHEPNETSHRLTWADGSQAVGPWEGGSQDWRDSWPPSWTDDSLTAEAVVPVEEMESFWCSLLHEAPFPPHEADEPAGRPDPDAQP